MSLGSSPNVLYPSDADWLAYVAPLPPNSIPMEFTNYVLSLTEYHQRGYWFTSHDYWLHYVPEVDVGQEILLTYIASDTSVWNYAALREIS